jgi:histidyl-tRNA synthetase
MLDERGIKYSVAPRLVRGLDYYMRTAFEIIGNQLGAQNTLVGGGRYDGLSQLLGGPPVKGFGFAFGIERMIMSMPESSFDPSREATTLFITYIGDEARKFSFGLASRLRGAGVSTVVDLEGRKLKKALAVANSLGSRYALIVGESEIQSGSFVLRRMDTGEQRNLSEVELVGELLKGV